MKEGVDDECQRVRRGSCDFCFLWRRRFTLSPGTTTSPLFACAHAGTPCFARACALCGTPDDLTKSNLLVVIKKGTARCAVIPAQAGIQLTLCVNLCNKSKITQVGFADWIPRDRGMTNCPVLRLCRWRPSGGVMHSWDIPRLLSRQRKRRGGPA